MDASEPSQKHTRRDGAARATPSFEVGGLVRAKYQAHMSKGLSRSFFSGKVSARHYMEDDTPWPTGVHHQVAAKHRGWVYDIKYNDGDRDEKLPDKAPGGKTVWIKSEVKIARPPSSGEEDNAPVDEEIPTEVARRHARWKKATQGCPNADSAPVVPCRQTKQAKQAIAAKQVAPRVHGLADLPVDEDMCAICRGEDTGEGVTCAARGCRVSACHRCADGVKLAACPAHWDKFCKKGECFFLGPHGPPMPAFPGKGELLGKEERSITEAVRQEKRQATGESSSTPSNWTCPDCAWVNAPYDEIFYCGGRGGVCCLPRNRGITGNKSRRVVR